MAQISCNAAAVITTETGTYPGVCKELSLDGTYVRCEAQPTSDSVSLIVCLPSLGPIELNGEIRERRQDGCVIRFTNLASAAALAICTFMGTVGTVW